MGGRKGGRRNPLVNARSIVTGLAHQLTAFLFGWSRNPLITEMSIITGQGPVIVCIDNSGSLQSLSYYRVYSYSI